MNNATICQIAPQVFMVLPFDPAMSGVYTCNAHLGYGERHDAIDAFETTYGFPPAFAYRCVTSKLPNWAKSLPFANHANC